MSEFNFHYQGSLPPPEDIVWQVLPPEDWALTLANICLERLKHQRTLILCLTGKPGSGKSTIGRLIRKHGLPGISARKILVIDDGAIHLKVLGIFPRRIQLRIKHKDYLEPFLPYLKRKRILVYVNATPEKRLERCDLFVRLKCPEELRRDRLIARDHNGAHRYQRTQEQSDEPQIHADDYYELLAAPTFSAAQTQSTTSSSG